MSNKDLKGRILAFIQYWGPILDLQNWAIKVSWDEKKHVATCRADPKYKVMFVRFNLTKIRKEIDDLEELVVHELVHGPLWLLARGLEDRQKTKVVEFIEENTTSTMTMALLRARAMGEQRSKRRE